MNSTVNLAIGTIYLALSLGSTIGHFNKGQDEISPPAVVDTCQPATQAKPWFIDIRDVSQAHRVVGTLAGFESILVTVCLDSEGNRVTRVGYFNNQTSAYLILDYLKDQVFAGQNPAIAEYADYQIRLLEVYVQTSDSPAK